MTKSVSIRQCRYFQWLIKENHLPYLLNEEKEVFDLVYKTIRDNKLYNKVWQTIEDEANRIIAEECQPKWNEIIAELDLNKKDSEDILKKEKELPEWESLSEEDRAKLEEYTQKSKDLVDAYEKVTTEANARLEEFKNNLLDNEYKNTKCFDLKNKDYDLIQRVTWWSVYDGQTEWNIVLPELKDE